MLPKQLHVQVTRPLDPVLMDLHSQRTHQTKATLRVREDPYHPRPTPDLSIQPLQHVRRLHVLVVSPRKTVERQRLVDVLLHLHAQLRIARLPTIQPRR